MRRPRGFSLLELMMVVAVTSIVLAAAVGVFVAMANRQRISERAVEAQSATVVAVSTIQRDLDNAGYRFPSAGYAVRYFNNVDGSTSIPSSPGTFLQVGADGCGPGLGLVPGTDVVEMASGFRIIGPGTATSVTMPPGATLTPTVRLRSGEPFTQTDIGNTPGLPATGVGLVLLFSNPAGLSCLAQVTAISPSGGGASVTLAMLDRNFLPLTVPTDAIPNCPANDMTVYRLDSRVRYMVCSTPGALPSQFRLYRQTALNNPTWSTPTLWQEGIEDLQVAGRYVETMPGVIKSYGTGTNCVPTPTAAPTAIVCLCDDVPTSPSCTALPPAGAKPPGFGEPSTFLRGVQVVVTGIGTQTASMSAGSTSSDFNRPAALDHPAPLTPPDNYIRIQQSFSVNFENLQVIP